MAASNAVVVLPPGACGKVVDPAQRRWLSRGRVARQVPAAELLVRVLAELGRPGPVSGPAALRFWGQTGNRSDAWMVAADPVHLQARMRDVIVLNPPPGEFASHELQALFDALQAALGGQDGAAFARIGGYAYLRAGEEFASPTVSAAVAHGQVPDRYAPTGRSAADYHRLLGETQMVLHDHPINLQRAAEGRLTANSLWLWGGGRAPAPQPAELPRLFAADPLFRGYWASCSAPVDDWPADLRDCFTEPDDDFVGVLPELPDADNEAVLSAALGALAAGMSGGSLRSLCLLFRDGLTVHLHARDRFRFWRRTADELRGHSGDDGHA